MSDRHLKLIEYVKRRERNRKLTALTVLVGVGVSVFVSVFMR